MTAKKAKLIAAAIGAVLAIIIIAQNTVSIETRILFITITMPRALLLLITFILGLVLGLLVATGTIRAKK